MAQPTPTWFDVPMGVALGLDPDDVPPGLAADLYNLATGEKAGALTPRPGSQSLCAQNAAPNYGHPANPLGNALWDWSAEVLVLVGDDANRRLFALAGSSDGKAKVHRADLSAVGPGFDAGTTEFDVDRDRIPSTAIYKGALYIATGTTTAVDNRVVQSSGNANASAAAIETPLTPSVTPTGSGVLTGTYRYAIVFRDSRTGSQGPASPVGTANPSADTVDVTVTKTTNALVDKIDIYRTTAGGGTLRYLTTVDNDGMVGTELYNDNIADDRLSYQTVAPRSGRPPTSRYCLVLGERMLWAVRTESPTDLNVLYYSEVGKPYVVDPVFNVVTVRPDDGDQITGLARLYNRGFVFKSRQIYELVDNQPLSVYRVDPIVNEGAIGCVAHATIKEIDGRLFFLSYNGPALFDGQSPRLIGGPIEAAFAETQLRHARTASTVGAIELEAAAAYFSFRNGDVATEVVDFEAAFFTGSTDPNDSGTGAAAEVLTTVDDPDRWVVSSHPITGDGVELEAGREVGIGVLPRDLQRGTRYTLWTRAHDGTQYTPWKSQGSYTYAPILPGHTDINWGLAGKFFALDYWPAHEYWLFIASAGSERIDTVWVLDYRTIDAEGGPKWRRYGIHATAATLVTGLTLDGDQQNLNLPILGDALGCVWAWGVRGNTDHKVVRDVELTDAQRVISVGRAVESARDVYTLAFKTDADRVAWLASTGGWPSSTSGGVPNYLNGERVVVRDSNGATYTGVITANSVDHVDVTFWLEGRIPPNDRDVEFAIGGIDAHFETFVSHLGDGDYVKQIRAVLLNGPGLAEFGEVELRTSAQPEALDSIASYARLRRVRFRDVQLGGGLKRLIALGRGLYAGLRVGTWRPGHRWILSRWGLLVIPTGSVR